MTQFVYFSATLFGNTDKNFYLPAGVLVAYRAQQQGGLKTKNITLERQTINIQICWTQRGGIKHKLQGQRNTV